MLGRGDEQGSPRGGGALGEGKVWAEGIKKYKKKYKKENPQYKMKIKFQKGGATPVHATNPGSCR